MLKTVLAGIVAFALSMAIAVGAVTILGGDDVDLGAIAESMSSDSINEEEPTENRPETASTESSTTADELGDSIRVATTADSTASPSPAVEQPSPALAASEDDSTDDGVTDTAAPSDSPIVTVILAETAPADSAQQARLGRIFAAMQPREAAKVLEQMNDGDVVRILGMLQERQAAAVLTSLPPPRAAAITRNGLAPAGSNP